MNGVDFLADTNFLIYLLEGRPEAALFADYSFAVSFVTEIELLGRYRISPEEKEIIHSMLDTCVIIDLPPVVKQKAAVLKQNRRIKLPDALIVATAQYFGLTLLTADIGFRNIPGIEVFLIELTPPKSS
ncbi:hypothetical protein GCM10023189_47340 [Nibrella saemangeumensis]|uniref:PIN domain-containing protein n=1 Tax=Nibrella saemangeumensis TaxID=1084526 RepID=A0ABP8NHG0_9BACT